ncbi:MAG TPA: beta galactosidase jelly roll domain-containing protein [Candidatus Eisenbacteria bacterium]|nr:beta galactosidase jelly roll domain-containing protein [Candidatus Eisenbacteria bacterium]
MSHLAPLMPKLILLFALFACITHLAATPSAPVTRLELHTGWQVQSACVLQGSTTGPAGLKNSNHPGLDGDTLSSPLYRPIGWIPTTVPATVVAAQVAAGVIKDPYYSMNLRDLSGMDYPLGSMFSNLAMLDDSPYKCGWWYRTQFRLPTSFSGHSVALHLDGVNYRADVWLNGKQIASKNEIAGTWRVFELNLSSGLHYLGENILAIEVFPPTPDDLAITWVDWAPSPPDKNTGLFRDVYLTASGPVQLRFPYVATKLNEDFTSAQLTPVVEAWNATGHEVTADISWEIEGKKVHQQVALEGEQKKTVSFDPAQFRELTLKDPKLWWPHEMGKPVLYHARVSVTADGKPSDSQEVTFGIRQVTSELNNGHTLFKINGKPVLIRGGGWAPDLLLRSTPERMETEFRYVRDLGLNTIRLEGKLETQAFYDLADKYGVLIMAGWCCCDMWERWNEWGNEQYRIAQASQRDQTRLLRNHPAMLVWLNGSDNPPIPAVESTYLRIEKEELWPNPTLSSASATPTTVTGPSGVKMTGPYDYVPPNYWLVDTKLGGAWGFNTETSPGPAIPTPASLRRFLPPDKLWPQNEVWGFHEGGERFQTLDFYNTSMEHRYGAPKDLNDFERKAYAMDYEGERAMFEAYARNKFNSTGVIQWMLNNAWPSLIWHLYDYYLVPAGGYYGTRKANEPMHVLYSYNDRSIAVVSSLSTSYVVKVTATLYNFDGTQKWTQDAMVDVFPDKASIAFTVPQLPDLSTTYFLKLYATDRFSKVESDNFYWLSTKADEMDWEKTHGTATTPQSAYADMTALQDLAPVTLRVQTKPAASPCAIPFAVKPQAAPTTPPVAAAECDGGFLYQQLTVSNPAKTVAFMVHLRLVKSDGEDVVPALFDDNFVSLLPGESRTIGVRYRAADLGKAPAHYQVSGWNVAVESVPLH